MTKMKTTKIAFVILTIITLMMFWKAKTSKLHYFNEGAYDYQLIQEYDLGDKINGRDNFGGIRKIPEKWIVKLTEDIDFLDFVNTLYEYQTKEIDDDLIESKVENYMNIIQIFHEDLIETNGEFD